MSAYYNYNDYVVYYIRSDEQRGIFCPECKTLHERKLENWEEFQCNCGYYLMKDEEFLRTSKCDLNIKKLCKTNNDLRKEIIKLKDTLRSVEYNLNAVLDVVAYNSNIEDKESISMFK